MSGKKKKRSPPPVIEGIRRCTRCKGELHPEAAVCPHCRLWQNPKQYISAYIQTVSTLWIVLMVFMFGVALVLLVIMLAVVFGMVGMFEAIGN